MLLIRSPINSTFSSNPSNYLSYQSSSILSSTPSSQISLRSPIFLSNTPRKRHLSTLEFDVKPPPPEDQLNTHTQKPLKKLCNRLDFTSVSNINLGKNNGSEFINKGDNNNLQNCEKGVNIPLNKSKLLKTINKMDIEMDENDMGMGMGIDMEGIIIQPKKPIIRNSPSLSSLNSSSSTRPKLGRLDTTTSLDFEPGLTIKQYPSSSSISMNEMSSSSSPTKSSSLLPVMHLKRNPKKLSLSLPSLSSSSTAYSTTSSSPSYSTPSTICPTPTYSNTESDSKFGTPYTPGPPKTPALAMSLGRSTFRGDRRPSLLSLITKPPGNEDLPPPTPGASGSGSHPYATMRLKNKGRARSHTAAEVLSISDKPSGSSSSAFGNASFPPIDEIDSNQKSSGLSALGYALPTTSSPHRSRSYNSSSPTTSSSSNISDDASGSTSSTPSTSPPLPTAFTFSLPLNTHNYQLNQKRQIEPYEDGPIEILPGIFLGTEESVFQFNSYSSSSTAKVRIINVAQEIDDPFDENISRIKGWSNPVNNSNKKGKEKMKLTTYPKNEEENRPEIEYCHIKWSHGESGLADLPDQANLMDILDSSSSNASSVLPEEGKVWGFWETIRWMEQGRRNGIPILIHCQCGVSRSATLAIAYTMALAAIGAMPDILGGIRSMQDAYDFVKSKSSWIGPNHSLVFQLVDFARHLTQLLSIHLSTPNSVPIKTSFPKNHDAELSEAEWARRRREFEESENGSTTSSSSEGIGRTKENECLISPEEADEEARRLDEEMLLRKARR